uniref:serine protease hepsin-like n=1 Tax=Pristiophorus japonicus TaxID=55135 RepID=UPI00398E814E
MQVRAAQVKKSPCPFKPSPGRFKAEEVIERGLVYRSQIAGAAGLPVHIGRPDFGIYCISPLASLENIEVMIEPEAGLKTGPNKRPESCAAGRRVVAITIAIACLLAAAAVTIWAVVTYVKKTETDLYNVQVNVDNHLSVYDREADIWRLVCSSSIDERVAELSCQQIGFVRMISFMESPLQGTGSNASIQFYCVNQFLILSAKVIQDALQPWRNRFPNQWMVFTGALSQSSEGVQRLVAVVVYHSGYEPFNDPNTDDNSNDIAVLRLQAPLNFSDYIQPLCLPAIGQPVVDGTMCSVTGWGNTEYYGQQSDVLREAHVPVISNNRCNSPEYYDNQITPKMFCAGYSEGGVDACQGDSGGPLVCEDNLSNKTRWRLCGIVSWGTGCAMAYKPGVYCRVTEYQEWIYRAMQMYKDTQGIHAMD